MLYGKDEQLSIQEFFIKKPILVWVAIFALVGCGFGFGGYGIYELVSTNDQEIVTTNDISSQVCEQTADFGQITVYISGAVKNPGVYILQSGNRVIDLLDASGGISHFADVVYVNRQFNMAKQLSDGEQLYIPTKAETEKQLAVQFETNNINAWNDKTQSGASVTTTQGPISINTSTKSELMKLSGIGEARATKIIENRPYSSVQELVGKEVLSSSLFKDLESQISL